jgi:hypothetical protein
MAITASVDITKTPIELTVTSDKRTVSVSVTTAGETAVGTATFPIVVTDATRTWTKKTDDGHVAVYTA